MHPKQIKILSLSNQLVMEIWNKHKADHETSLLQNCLIIMNIEQLIKISFFSSIHNHQNHEDLTLGCRTHLAAISILDIHHLSFYCSDNQNPYQCKGKNQEDSKALNHL